MSDAIAACEKYATELDDEADDVEDYHLRADTLRVTPKNLGEIFGVTEVPPFEPWFNIAPTQPVVAVRTRPENSTPSA